MEEITLDSITPGFLRSKAKKQLSDKEQEILKKSGKIPEQETGGNG